MAKLIDLAITAALAFIALVFYVFLYLHYGEVPGLFKYEPLTVGEAYRSNIPFLLLLVVVLVHEVVMVRWRGQTLGKMLLGIQVISYSDSLVPVTHNAFIRWIFPLAAMGPLVDAFIRDIPEFGNNSESPALSGRLWWVWVALGWWLLVQVSLLWDVNRRGWHDKAAGTIVVKLTP